MRPAQPVGVAVGRGVLPLFLLVGMGEQVGGNCGAGKVLCTRGGLGECTHVGDKGSVTVIEECLNIRQAGM